ncbi:hypothetical protein DDE82_008295 [Stemphylium lycopersici]|uniref:Uncharacterized protein n=1 Tax=Stemphylium lycopersici TaxID=183478 RepID=A0A364MW57_STELY|nr:hypothetical protein TW65_03015 [Stemphylium lycopersici]RAQ99409.1 hypothetical protein DDE82_008295 [Stemphylium lycopersici]RAR05016.1 hypothetical protein DDE83_007594 [Stemphylium lycopersici]
MPNDINATNAILPQIRLQHRLPDLAAKVDRGHEDGKLEFETAMREAPVKKAKLVNPGWVLQSSTPSEASGKHSVVAMLDTVPPETGSESEPTALIVKPFPHTLQHDPPTSAQKLQPPKRRDTDDRYWRWSTHSRLDSFNTLSSEPTTSTISDVDKDQRREPDTKHKDIRVSINCLDDWFSAMDEAEEGEEEGQPENCRDF